MYIPDAKRAEQRNLLIAIGLTSTIMGVEFLGGFLSNSLALTSDAWHMFADLTALILCYMAGRVSIRPPTWNKTYGYHRVEILSALLNGGTLMLVAAFIFYEALKRVFTVEEVHGASMLAVAAVGFAANLVSMTVMSRRMLSLNVKAAFLHVFSDTLSSIGVIAGAVIIHYTGFFIVDSIIGVGIGLTIMYGSGKMLRTVVNILLEGAPSHIDPKRIVERLMEVDGVLGVHDIHVWSITSYVHVLSAHLVVRGQAMKDTNGLLNKMKTILQEEFGISHSTLQLEKEGYREVGQVCSF
jgi:cobalt-zinc-cadmium efflux system protein